MALDRIDFPTTPNPVSGDWDKIVSLVAKSFQNINSPLQVYGTNIPRGAVFQVGGIIYYGTSDTEISGTSSDYVKIEPNSGDSGATALASFIASLNGVAWNNVYNGYYDSSGNLYVFDEAKAVATGAITSGNSRLGAFAEDAHVKEMTVYNNLSVTNDITAKTIKASSDITTKTIKASSGYLNDYLYDSAIYRGNLYNTLAPYLPVIGDTMLITGGIYDSALGYIWTCSNAYRGSGTTIYIRCVRVNGSLDSVSLHSGDVTHLLRVSIAW